MIGANAEFMYVGTPSWDVGGHTLTGAAEALADSLRTYAEIGVDQIQIRFRSRNVDELCDQLAAFGAEVAPLLPR